MITADGSAVEESLPPSEIDQLLLPPARVGPKGGRDQPRSLGDHDPLGDDRHHVSAAHPQRTGCPPRPPTAHAELCCMTGLSAAGGLQGEQVRPTEPVGGPGRDCIGSCQRVHGRREAQPIHADVKGPSGHDQERTGLRAPSSACLRAGRVPRSGPSTSGTGSSSRPVRAPVASRPRPPVRSS